MPVFIQSKIPPRQKGEKYPAIGPSCRYDIRIDVTSGQRTASLDRAAFSPMTQYAGRYHGFYCFENFWQSGKRFKELGHLKADTKTKDIQSWKKYEKPYRRHPKAKGLCPVDAVYPDVDDSGKSYGYVESRKAIYVPLYHADIANGVGKHRLAELQQVMCNTIMIVDYDGPKVVPGPNDSDEVIYSRPCLEVTKELLIEKINDPQFQFGHGYIVAAALLGMKPAEYTEHTEHTEQQASALSKAPKPKPIKIKAKNLVKPKVSIVVKKHTTSDCTCCSDKI
jgi:hypothetical protein